VTGLFQHAAEDVVGIVERTAEIVENSCDFVAYSDGF
jgi:hypothetical protein